jgi:3-carboxy-cis,cis-muconate cycloisomerase
MERKQMSKSVPTAATVIDSVLFRDAFGTPRMREVFSDHALVSRYVEVEIALARAEARCGVIPAEAADEIAAKCNITSLDFDLLRQETDIVGYPILPLVHQLVKQCGNAGRYVHWGATTQDIMDTAVVLQIRDGLATIEEDIDSLRSRRHPIAAKMDHSASVRISAALDVHLQWEG